MPRPIVDVRFGSNADLVKVIRALHAHPAMGVLYSTGAGLGLPKLLWQPGGASATLIDGGAPYSRHRSAKLMGGAPKDGSSVCREVAHRLAHAAFIAAEETVFEDPDLDNTTPVFGLGLTAAVATTRERRGKDHVWISVFTNAGFHDVYVEFNKEWHSRDTEDDLVELFALNTLCAVLGIDQFETRLYNRHQKSEMFVEGRSCRGSIAYGEGYHWYKLAPELFTGVTDLDWNGDKHIFIPRDEDELDPEETVLYAGSFNPVTFGHVNIVRETEKQTGLKVAYLLTDSHPVKGDRSLEELAERANQLADISSVLLVKGVGLYIDLARQFPGHQFLIGADVVLAILDPKWYGGSLLEVSRMLREFTTLGTRFLVAGRTIDGEYLELGNLPIPHGYPGLFRAVGGRWDASSTEKRKAQKEAEMKQQDQ